MEKSEKDRKQEKKKGKKRKRMEREKGKKKKNYRAVIQSIEMQIIAAFTVLFGTDSSCLQVRDLKGFIYSVD